MSHRLPQSVHADLRTFVTAVEDRLQAEAHKVSVAVGEHAAFDVRWVDSDLTRALICFSACMLSGQSLGVNDLGNGGVELTHVHGGVERRIRLKRAERDASGCLVVKVGSDSILTGAARATEATLFEQYDDALPVTHEQWVLAYMLRPSTHTFMEVKAGRVVGLLGQRPPYRLKLADIVDIPFLAPPPTRFRGDKDDLNLGEEEGDESGGEATG